MLVKTERFNNVLLTNISQLKLYRDQQIKIVGSYNIKDYGDLLTDIDIQLTINFNDPNILLQIKNILNNIDKNMFKFMFINCGIYNEFKLPWTIDNEGSCSYEPFQVKEWFNKFKTEKLVPDSIYTIIETKLFSTTISIKNLIDVQNILLPYAQIVWLASDLLQGYKEYRGIQYFFTELTRNGELAVMEYIYRYISETGKVEICAIDVALIDKTIELSNTDELYNYYLQHWYPIFKSYKWFIRKEYFNEYKQALKHIEKLNLLYNIIHNLINIDKYKILDKEEIEKVRSETIIIMKQLNIKYQGKKISDIEKMLYDMINQNMKSNVDYFIDKIKDDNMQKKIEFQYRYLISIYGNIPITQQTLTERSILGYKCPFLGFTETDYNFLTNLGHRILIDPKLLIDCVVKISEKYNLSVADCISQFFDHKNNLSLEKSSNNIILYDSNTTIGMYPNQELKALQIRILFG
jgi:hypothetical protein|uniref:Uncharacterized protein n=1 Tax=viral metagenome TaxID=1070528 RepID=A0A6C0D0T2_9ZZZZ